MTHQNPPRAAATIASTYRVYRELGAYLAEHSAIATRANPGLLMDRYADIWPAAAGPDKMKFLMRVVELAKCTAKDVGQELLRPALGRLDALCNATGAHVIHFELVAPMVSGLSISSALEVGMVWNRNLGVPYLPGSSLKGAARAWAEYWAAEQDREIISDIFGDGPPNDRAGDVIFFDALPVDVPTLRLDVMNLHFAPYYQSNGKVDPTDWLSPVPIYFLTVAPKTVFRCAVLSRSRRKDSQNKAAGFLLSALSEIGAGAKTSAGYGLCKKAKEPAKEKLESMSLSAKSSPVVITGSKLEDVVLVTNVNKGKARVRTTDNVEIQCSSLPSYEAPKTGESIRADVMRDNGVPKFAKFKGKI